MHLYVSELTFVQESLERMQIPRFRTTSTCRSFKFFVLQYGLPDRASGISTESTKLCKGLQGSTEFHRLLHTNSCTGITVRLLLRIPRHYLSYWQCLFLCYCLHWYTYTTTGKEYTATVEELGFRWFTRTILPTI